MNRIEKYTPLMLAIELNLKDIFSMMIKAGGDTSLTFLLDGKAKTCKDIKAFWNSEDIVL